MLSVKKPLNTNGTRINPLVNGNRNAFRNDFQYAHVQAKNIPIRRSTIEIEKRIEWYYTCKMYDFIYTTKEGCLRSESKILPMIKKQYQLESIDNQPEERARMNLPTVNGLDPNSSEFYSRNTHAPQSP